MSPECQQCGSHVSNRWKAVFANPESGDVEFCLDCSVNSDRNGMNI